MLKNFQIGPLDIWIIEDFETFDKNLLLFHSRFFKKISTSRFVIVECPPERLERYVIIKKLRDSYNNMLNCVEWCKVQIIDENTY